MCRPALVPFALPFYPITYNNSSINAFSEYNKQRIKLNVPFMEVLM